MSVRDSLSPAPAHTPSDGASGPTRGSSSHVILSELLFVLSTSSTAGLVNNEEKLPRLTCRPDRLTVELTQRNPSWSSRPYCLFFSAIAPPTTTTHTKPAAMLFTCSPPQSSSTMLVFFHRLPSPPSLCLSILSLLLFFPVAPFTIRTYPALRAYPAPPPLPTASRPFPHLARRAPHECQAGIQGVCRRASLNGSAGAAAGRMSCPDSPGSKRQKHAVLIGWSHPPPLPDWSWLPCEGPALCRGACDVLWRVECTHRWCLYSSAIMSYWCHTGVQSLHSSIHLWLVH